jgi:hypothetical protein
MLIMAANIDKVKRNAKEMWKFSIKPCRVLSFVCSERRFA